MGLSNNDFINIIQICLTISKINIVAVTVLSILLVKLILLVSSI